MTKAGFTLDFTSPEEQDRMAASTSAPYNPYATSNHSYLTHKSAPSTPGIFSQHIPNTRPSTSSSIKHRHRHHPEADLSRAHSAVHIPLQSHRFEANTARTRCLHKSALQLHADDGEWLFRAGATIANDVEDSKGQGWLSQRASSTSLVGLGNEDEDGREQFGGNGDRATPWEVRRRRLELDARSRSRVASARTSRVPSRAQSTRASRSNSGVGMDGLGMTSGRALQVEERDYFGKMVEDLDHDDPDELEDSVEALYNVEDEGLDADEEEDELARLTKERSFGLGSFVDRFMAWTIFSPSNGNDDTDEPSLREEDKEARFDMSGNPTKAPAKYQEGTSVADGGGWKDMVWLFGVAVAVLF